MERTKKPVPVVTPWGMPFWQAAREGKLVIQKCSDCHGHIFYPRLLCPHCGSQRLAWTEASGRGTIYSYTVVRSNAPSAFLEDMPYVVAVIRLAEGVQMLSNIVGCDPDQLACDMPVEVVFETLTEEFKLPKFRPLPG
ncbi:MAG: Zn-ribbon domain-containing OB-fold protein [bacterium]